ncbi:membrane protein [Clostridioides difficile]|nr:membrane protein [Clostridioides difficile]VHX74539.1 membrane protein [Clostridioides difficile]VIF67800.1 membrane protein [Clostridioides difficile]
MSMYKKHKFIKNIKQAWYKIKLIDRCLIIVMAILMFQSIYNLFVNEVNSQDTTTIDVVVRTTSAAIFGYFLSVNFIKRPSRKYINTDVSSNFFIDNNLSKKSQESSQNNVMNVKNTIGFTSETDNYEKKIPTNNTEDFEDGDTSELQIVIATVICVVALTVLFVVRNFTTTTSASLGTISQMRDFVSGCVGFLLGCPSRPD